MIICKKHYQKTNETHHVFRKTFILFLDCFVFKALSYVIVPLAIKPTRTIESSLHLNSSKVVFPIATTLYLWLYRIFNPISYIVVEYVSRDFYNLLTILDDPTVKRIYRLIIQYAFEFLDSIFLMYCLFT